MIAQHVLLAGWHPTGALGTQYGTRAAAHAAEIGVPAGVNVFLDLEGIPTKTDPQLVIDYSNNWYDAVLAQGYVPGLYVGADSILTADQLANLKFKNFWKSPSTVPTVTGRGYQMIQSLAAPNYGLKHVDNDVTQNDIQGGTAQWLRE